MLKMWYVLFEDKLLDNRSNLKCIKKYRFAKPIQAAKHQTAINKVQKILKNYDVNIEKYRFSCEKLYSFEDCLAKVQDEIIHKNVYEYVGEGEQYLYTYMTDKDNHTYKYLFPNMEVRKTC